MSKITQRDAFWDRVYDLARHDRNIVVVTEDMGAPALDKFRLELPSQFINVGIAEQNGLLVAAGLAMEGKHPFVYAIAPFVTLRCLEQIRVANAIMNIPVTLVGVGAGFGYEDSGPTHHLIEDIAIMRSMPNITIHSVSDATVAAAVATECCAAKSTHYVRLDRKALPELHAANTDFSGGFTTMKDGTDGLLIATGIMTHTALELAAELKKSGINLTVLDLYRIPCNEAALSKLAAKAKAIITLEEHFLTGGVGSYLLEILNNNGLQVPVKRFGITLAQGYTYVYGGRTCIHEHYGLDLPTLKTQALAFLGGGSGAKPRKRA